MSKEPIQGRRLPCRVALLTFFICLHCRAVSFNTQFLAGNSAQSNITAFYNDASLPDGEYHVDVFINSEWKGNFPVTLRAQRIFINGTDVPRLGLRTDIEYDNDGLQDIQHLVQHGQAKLNATEFSLNLQIPQAYIAGSQRGYVPPSGWTRGINGAVLSYNTNYYRTMEKRSVGSGDSFYTSLNSGVNFWGWQLRDSSGMVKNASEKTQWQNNTRYLTRGFSDLHAELSVGDSYTSSALFDSFKFRGLRFSTDLRMLPDSQQGFVPVIRGVAQTSALVKVQQNGVTIAQLNVPPGPFIIDDLFPSGSGGDLTIEVNEADGRIERFLVPFSSVPNMLKSGVFKYSVDMGKVRIKDARYQPSFLQGTMQYGFNNTVTGYSGLQIGEDYQALQLGGGFNLAAGAVSMDITRSRYRQLNNITREGQSYKLAYSRFFPVSGTNFSLAAYRYSTRDYLSLTDAVNLHDSETRGFTLSSYRQQKNTFNVNLNQTLDQGWGAVFVSGTFRQYWGRNDSVKEYQVGYANGWGKVNYSVSGSRTQNGGNQEENRFYVMLSLPLSVFDSPVWITSSGSIMDGRYASSNLGFSGSNGPSGRFNYNANLTDSRSGSQSGSINASLKTQSATLAGAYSESADYRQFGLGTSGSLSLTREGFLTTYQPGDTFAIVNAPGVAGAAVNGDRNVMTNPQGKALVATLSPYRSNRIVLDTPADEGAELTGNTREVVPYSGAIAYLEYKTDVRQRFLVPARLYNGDPLPFATSVFDEHGASVGYVGQGSEIYIRANRLPRLLHVNLSPQGNRSCQIIRPHTGRESGVNICQPVTRNTP